MDGEAGKAYLTKYSKRVAPVLEAYIQKKTDDARHVGAIPAELLRRFGQLASRGKRIRGALMELGYELAGGTDTSAILEASITIELLHAGFLVHDDIMDRDTRRRGLPTIHTQFEQYAKHHHLHIDPSQYGTSMAINTGDIAFFLAWDALIHAPFPAANIQEATQLLTDYTLRVIYGQTLDVSTLDIASAQEKDILSVFRYKTAEYTGVLPLLLGATLGGMTNQKKRKALEQYGLSLGWAFQIQDDILGMFGDEKITGKPVGSDLREGKLTLLMLHLSHHGSTEQKAFQQKVFGKKSLTQKEISKMQEILKSAGSYDYVAQLGKQYVTEGMDAIVQTTNDPYLASVLRSLLSFMMERLR